MTDFFDSSTPRCPQGGLGVAHAGHTEAAVTGDMSSYGMRGLGDLTTLGTDLANGDIAAVFSDVLPYLLGAGALYLVWKFVLKGGGAGGGSSRRRMSQARKMADYEMAKARVGA